VPDILQLKISLAHISPPVWRRIQVRNTVSLLDLHDIIQVAFGWEDAHLHEFRKGRQSVFDSAALDFDPSAMAEREARTPLNRFLMKPKDKLAYLYDFGDSWLHKIAVEKVLDPEPGTAYPVCLAGARLGPPEDCGGVWGYQSMVEVLKDPGHNEYEHYLEWVGEGFDPEAFDLNEINSRVRHLSTPA
jgi:hypothetical protein